MTANFDSLVGRIQTASDALQQDALVVINRSVTARAWITGYYIVEYEQNGEDRAKYGEGLLKTLSKRLGGDSFSVPSLKKYRLFYRLYPNMVAPVTAYIVERFGKGYSPIIQLPLDETQKGYSPIIQSSNEPLIIETNNSIGVSPWHLFNRLSYTHITNLINLPDELQRTFYAFEAIRGAWSVRALRRQIDSQYYQRVGWANDPHKLAALAQGRAERLNVADFVKQNAVLEFLGLKPQGDWDEKDLEDGIIENLKQFIREMGVGFCLEDQQQNILIDDVYERIDLVFYHRILKCHVLIELKSKKLSYKDIAQLNLYMAYYRQNKMTTGDNPPIGILMCTDVGKETVEYLAPFTDPALFISQYQLQLPPKEKMVEFLKKENAKGGAK